MYPPDFFAMEPYRHKRLQEYLLTDALTDIAKTKPVMVVLEKRWITVTYPEDVAKAEELLKHS